MMLTIIETSAKLPVILLVLAHCQLSITVTTLINVTVDCRFLEILIFKGSSPDGHTC